MSNGYRSLGIAALAAALLIAFGLGAYWTGLPYPQERYQPYQDGKANDGGALTSVPNITKPVVKRTPCDNPQSETESDLCAQWRAAIAGEKSAYWTFWGFWATLAGMALLTWQIMLTREAVKDTGDATIAMQESNRIADAARRSADNHARSAIRTAKLEALRNQSNAERQMRAYLDFNGIKFLRDENRDTQESFRIGISVTVQNYGQTPAKEVTLSKVYSLKVKGGEWKSLKIDNATEPDNVGRIAASDHAGFELYFDIPRSLWGLLDQGKTVFRVDADISYSDIFDKPQSVSGSYISKFVIMENFGLIAGTRKHT
jgi:hypothetical protein